MLSRTETRTRERIHSSRDDRARIATCCLRTATDVRNIRILIVEIENVGFDEIQIHFE